MGSTSGLVFGFLFAHIVITLLPVAVVGLIMLILGGIRAEKKLAKVGLILFVIGVAPYPTYIIIVLFLNIIGVLLR